MSQLTKYWREKKYALNLFLNAFGPANADRQAVRAWLDRITVTPVSLPGYPAVPAAAPETLLLNALADLQAARDSASEMTTPPPVPRPNPQRRSKRLLSLIQGNIGDVPHSAGFSSVIGDVHPGGGGPGGYYVSATKTSVAAAVFLSAVKSERQGDPALAVVLAALTNLIAAAPAPPTVDPYVLECVKGLAASIDRFILFGGGGDGSGYWPSVIIVSSSSSGR